MDTTLILLLGALSAGCLFCSSLYVSRRYLAQLSAVNSDDFKLGLSPTSLASLPTKPPLLFCFQGRLATLLFFALGTLFFIAAFIFRVLAGNQDFNQLSIHCFLISIVTATCLTIALVDVASFLIPPSLNLLLLIASLCYVALSSPSRLVICLVCSALLLAALLLIGAFYQKKTGQLGLGGADILALPSLCLSLGPLNFAMSFCVALSIYLGLGILHARLMGRKLTGKTPIALGPSIAGCAALGLLLQPFIS